MLISSHFQSPSNLAVGIIRYRYTCNTSPPHTRKKHTLPVPGSHFDFLCTRLLSLCSIAGIACN
jgi:hypothetical protein